MVVNLPVTAAMAVSSLPRLGDGSRSPLPWSAGDTVVLEVGPRNGAELLLLSPQGVAVRVPGLGALADLNPGALLLMRVLATEPGLQLQRLPDEPQTAAGMDSMEAADQDVAAMRDWPRLLQSFRSTWDVPALAADWRARMQLLAERWQPPGPLPWQLRQWTENGVAYAHADMPLPERTPMPGPWPLTCYLPGGWPLRLSLRRRHARRRSAVSPPEAELCLTLELPTLGPLCLRVAQGPMGVNVCFEVQRQALAEQLSLRQPEVAQQLKALGLPLAGWKVTTMAAPAAEQRTARLPALPSYAVFHAGAELLALAARLETVSPAPPRC